MFLLVRVYPRGGVSQHSPGQGRVDRGVCGQGLWTGAVDRGCKQGVWICTPPDTPPEVSTEVGGMHPTKMHTCIRVIQDRRAYAVRAFSIGIFCTVNRISCYE